MNKNKNQKIDIWITNILNNIFQIKGTIHGVQIKRALPVRSQKLFIVKGWKKILEDQEKLLNNIFKSVGLPLEGSFLPNASPIKKVTLQ